MKKINYKSGEAGLIIKKFIDYCKEREEFNSRDRFILGEAYLEYFKNE